MIIQIEIKSQKKRIYLQQILTLKPKAEIEDNE